MKIVALVLFIAMYVMMIVLPKYRPLYSLSVALIFIITGILPINKVLSSVNWNVFLMITGTMIMVDYFIESKMPNLLAEILIDKSGTVLKATIYMSLFSGFISAFIDNVATVLIVAPVGLAICKKLNINPVLMILSIAVSSNLQGAATLVGDTTSIMLADYANMDFLDFFWMKNRPGIFFAVEFGALATVPIMAFVFRNNRERITNDSRTLVDDYLPTIMLLIMVLALISASFIPNAPSIINGVICCSLSVVMVVISIIRTRKTDSFSQSVKNLDFETLGLLFGLFLVIGGITHVGLVNDIASLLSKGGKHSLFLLYTVIVWGSVLISAFIDNIPYVATMLPILAVVTEALGIEPYLLFFGLLTGATLGGNLTPVGASANITAAGLLKKEGYLVSFKEFRKIGLPFTLTAVTVGYLFIWFLWS